jgi:hypothetical protein
MHLLVFYSPQENARFKIQNSKFKDVSRARQFVPCVTAIHERCTVSPIDVATLTPSIFVSCRCWIPTTALVVSPGPIGTAVDCVNINSRDNGLHVVCQYYQHNICFSRVRQEDYHIAWAHCNCHVFGTADQPTKELTEGGNLHKRASRCPSGLFSHSCISRITGLSNRHLKL